MSAHSPAEAGCELMSGLFYYWSLLRNNNNMITNRQSIGVLPHVAVEHRHLWQVTSNAARQ